MRRHKYYLKKPDIFKRAHFTKAYISHRNAARVLQSLDSQARENVLLRIADALEQSEEEIMKENAADMALAREANTDPNLIQRLGLTPQKLKNLCAGIRSIAKQQEPIRKVWPILQPCRYHSAPNFRLK